MNEKVETERVISKRKPRKIIHALEYIERHYLKEEKTYKTAIRSVKVAYTGENQDLAEQQQNDPQVRIQAEDYTPEFSEGSSDENSAGDPAPMQLQRWTPKL